MRFFRPARRSIIGRRRRGKPGGRGKKAIVLPGETCTNGLKKRFSLSAYDIAQGAGALVGIVQGSKAGRGGQAPPVLLLAPPAVTALTDFAEMFEGAEAKSRRFPEHFGRVARATGCAFLDTSTVITASPLDGIHFEAAEHNKLGRAVAAKIEELLGRA